MNGWLQNLMNACINCHYHVFPDQELPDVHECSHPDALCRITGERRFCIYVRTDPVIGVCGPEGKLFKPK